MGEGDHGHEDTVQHNLETCKQRHTRGIRVSQGGRRPKGRTSVRPFLALFVRPFGLPRPRGQTCLVSVARFVHRAGEQLEADDGVDYHDERHQQHDLGEGDHGQHDGVNDDLQACISRQAGFPERVGVNSTVIISIAI